MLRGLWSLNDDIALPPSTISGDKDIHVNRRRKKCDKRQNKRTKVKKTKARAKVKKTKKMTNRTKASEAMF